MSNSTPVLFRMTGRGLPADVKAELAECVAVFPTLPGANDPLSMSCYTLIGQHSACHRDWVRYNTRPAIPAEYAGLKAELENLKPEPYKLEIVHAISRTHDRVRREALGAQKVLSFFKRYSAED